MGASEKFYLTISNDSKTKTLAFNSIHFDWGRETEDHTVVIPPKTTAQVLVAQGRENASSGTEGYIIYEIAGLPNRWVKASWDVPWKAGAINTCTLSTSDDGHGENPDGTIIWQGESPLTCDGTTLSVLVRFGYAIEG